MSGMKLSAQTLLDVAAVIKPNLGVDLVPTGPGMYEALDRNFDQFKDHLLVSAYDFSEPWGSWERHPAGDEIVILLSGRVEFVLRRDEGDDSVSLDQNGDYLVIPQGIWHTAKTAEPSRLLFITPGEGTEHGQDPRLL
ncbi:cupin domain-containing protein [Simiduia curdlanivorans]|uniref:Cupin domain-containing protein n=1 Tax=Simiduia curdlanivorans TaxID=1492769 RepID=A0ABV8V6J0_9GAMM|nr:cupin domain-containing protein [Simiduia curdlanivorans]MDN3638833.1 cupin domain-containing protein [Simiduia curdlanivorans]